MNYANYLIQNCSVQSIQIELYQQPFTSPQSQVSLLQTQLILRSHYNAIPLSVKLLFSNTILYKTCLSIITC